jgi:hypothetical protein
VHWLSHRRNVGLSLPNTVAVLCDAQLTFLWWDAGSQGTSYLYPEGRTLELFLFLFLFFWNFGLVFQNTSPKSSGNVKNVDVLQLRQLLSRRRRWAQSQRCRNLDCDTRFSKPQTLHRLHFASSTHASLLRVAHRSLHSFVFEIFERDWGHFGWVLKIFVAERLGCRLERELDNAAAAIEDAR